MCVGGSEEGRVEQSGEGVGECAGECGEWEETSGGGDEEEGEPVSEAEGGSAGGTAAVQPVLQRSNSKPQPHPHPPHYLTFYYTDYRKQRLYRFNLGIEVNIKPIKSIFANQWDCRGTRVEFFLF